MKYKVATLLLLLAALILLRPERMGAVEFKEDAVTNETITEEPTAEESTQEESTAEEPTPDEPTAEEPTADESTADESTPEEPTAEEPTPEEPAAEVKEPKEEVKQGLIKKEDGSLFYYRKGKPLRGTLKKIKVDGEVFYYYFRKDGKALTNSWKTIDGDKYYFGKHGKAYTGKRKVGEDYYFFSEKGRRKSGFRTIHEKTYYFSEKNGKMLTGKQHVSHYLCCFSEKGVLLRKIDKDKKMVALTYDDGPSIYTEDILDVLEKHQAVATFFVVGNRVSRYADFVKRADVLGCEIGNHTYEHKTLTRLGKESILSQMARTDAAVKRVIGKEPVIMRPPGGSNNSTVNATVQKPVLLWSVDTIDWKTRDKTKIENAVLNRIRDGDIVLMHDLYQSTASAAEKIVSTLLERGYQLVTISELAECRTGMKSGVKYSQFRP